MQPFHSCRALLPLFTDRRTDRLLRHFVDAHVVVEVLLLDASQALVIIAERSDIWLVIVGRPEVALQDRAIYKIDQILVADFKHNEG